MESVSMAIRRLGREAQVSGSDVVREAARRTGGLPVWSDMGGVLVLMPTTEVVQYDPETGTSAPVHDLRWIHVSLVKAARSHAELVSLAPARPADAVECTQCGGSGRLFDTLDCSQCMGAGWSVPTT
jgi:hypothetical protein